MIKGQRWQRGQREPFRFGSIILTCDWNGRINTNQVSNGDCSPARVAVHLGVSTYLLKV